MAAEPTPSGRSPAALLSRVRAWLGAPGTSRRMMVRNGLWESSSFALTAVVMFFLSPFIVHRLGDSLYGVWEIVISLVGYLGFADLGVRPAAVHFIAQYDARKDHAGLNRFVNSSLLAFAGAGVLVLLVASPLAFALPRFWHLAGGFESQATAAVLIMAGGFALALPFNAFSAVIVGKLRYDLLGAIRVLSLVVRTVLIIVVLSQGWGLVALALVAAGSDLLMMAGYTLVAFRLEPALRFAPRLANRESMKRLFRFGGWAMVVIIALQVTWQTDALVIGHAISAAAVAFFAIGAKLALYARDLLRVMVRTVEPASARMFGVDDREGIRRMLTRSVRLMFLFAGPVLVYLLVVGKPFLRHWMGPEYAVSSWQVLTIMTFAVLPVIGSGPIASVHYGTGRTRQLAVLVIVEACANLGLSIWLVQSWGIEGVAIGTLIPATIVHGVLLPLGMCRYLGMSWPRFALRTAVGPLLAAGLTWLALRALVDAEASYGYPALFGLAALSVVIYAVAALLVRFAWRPLLAEDAS